MKILYKDGHKPIKHSAPSSDGGFLETTITGVTNLSNGSMVYGDASEQVTELNAGSLNDVLTMGATLPSWVPPSTPTSSWETIADVSVTGVPGALHSGTFSAPDKWLKICGYVGSVANTVSGITCNQTAGALEYALNFQRDFTTSGTAGAEGSLWYLSGVTSNDFLYFETNIYNGGSTDDKLAHTRTTAAGAGTGANAPYALEYFSKWYGGAYITRFDLTASTGIVQDYQVGSRILVLATPG